MKIEFRWANKISANNETKIENQKEMQNVLSNCTFSEKYEESEIHVYYSSSDPLDFWIKGIISCNSNKNIASFTCTGK